MARKQVTEPRATQWLWWSEWGAGIVLTLLIVGLHVQNLRHAGALWRDEAAAVALAQKPTFGAVGSTSSTSRFRS